MVDRDFLARMKPTAYVVNTARGEIVDNGAMREAVLSGTIAGAGFDTLYPEPTPADHPLVALPRPFCDRVVLAPIWEASPWAASGEPTATCGRACPEGSRGGEAE